VKLAFEPSDFARTAFFALLPAVAAGGAMGLPLLISLAGLAALRPSLLGQLIEKRPIALVALTAFVAWAAISSIWSPFNGPSWAKVGALFLLGLVFAAAAARSAAAARLTLAAALGAFVVVALLLAVEAITGNALNTALQPGVEAGQVNMNPSRGLVVMLAMAWPLLAWLIAQGRPIFAIVLAVAAGALSLQFDQLSTAIGFGAGLIVFLIAFVAPRLSILLTSAGLAVWVIAAPFVTPLVVANPHFVDSVPLSWAARTAIWRYACERILEQPWIGHGIDAGRTVVDRLEVRGLDLRAIPVHPHSASLQTWFDTGAVGASLLALALLFGGWRLARSFAHDKPAAAAAAASFAMLGLMANVGWSIWQEWWMATLILAAGLVAAVGARAAKA
jgi:O-antigen ligase